MDDDWYFSISLYDTVSELIAVWLLSYFPSGNMDGQMVACHELYEGANDAY